MSGGAIRKVTVIGAGVVGLAAAVALRRDGHDVTVIDRLPPGEACSFGNSGAMPRNHAVPMSTPGILRKVPGYLLDPLGPLAFRWRHLPALAPWLVTFLRSSRPERFNHILTTLTRLMQQSHADWSVLLRDAGMTDRVRENGALSIYRSAEAREAAWPLWQMLIERGAKLDRLDEDALRAIEPGLPDGYCCAVLEHDYRHATDSHRIPMGLAEHFLRLGGVIRRETVSEIEIGPTGPRALRTNQGEHPLDLLVVAAGAWSGPFAARLGHTVPLEAARGYHVTFLDPGITRPQHVLFVTDMRLSLTPMERGLRVGGNVEFAGLGTPPDFRRPARQIENVRRLFPHMRPEPHTKWSGDRPMMPDSLPVIGRSPIHRNVLYAFGHGQYGLALAAATGRLVAELAAERPPVVDLSPFRIDRF
jgi:D-amino-acid dehydrogenase